MAVFCQFKEKRKLEEAENLNAITKRRKEIQIAIALTIFHLWACMGW